MTELLERYTRSTVADFDNMRVLHSELKNEVDCLKKAKDWAEALIKQYSDLYDFSCVGFFTLDRSGTICEVNESGADLLRRNRKTLLGRRMQRFVSVDDRRSFAEFLSNLFETAEPLCREMELTDGRQEPRYVSIEAKVSNNSQECRLAVMDLTEQKKTEAALRFLTIFDPLTGLHNRGFFQEEMARLESGRNYPITILMADLDNLKYVNDRFGHAAGDAAIRRVGRLMKSIFRTEDIVARIGGDEFAVLLPGSGEEAARDAVGRLRQKIDEENGYHHLHPVSLSLGFSTALNQQSLWDLLRDADRKMYEEKNFLKAYAPRESAAAQAREA